MALPNHGATSYADIISKPPFFAITGVNPTAPIPQQMEQIDQLNTLLLQEIDANFARLHQVVTARILPEIKRFALANQPTREAAAFWNDFYAQAFGVRVRPEDGQSTLASHSPERTQYEDHTLPMRQDTFDQTRDGTWLFDPELGTTSTPLPAHGGRGSGSGIGAGAPDDSSFDDPLGSPYERLDRQLSRLSMDNTDDHAPTPSLPSGYGSVKSPESPDFDSTLRYEAPVLTSTPRASRTNDRPAEQVSPTLYRSPMNPRLIDLTTTPLGTDFRPLAPSSIANTARGGIFSRIPASKPSAKGSLYDDDDDIKLGMSPPVTMKFSLPPNARSIVERGTTPIKPSAIGGSGGRTARELDDLIDNMSDYEPSPRMPTPENLRRYSVMPGDLEAARKLFAEDPVPQASSSAGPSHPSLDNKRLPMYDDTYNGGGRTRRSIANTSFGSDIQIQRDVTGRIIGDDESIDNDDDSDSSAEDDTAGYAAQAAEGFEFVDNSYDSEASGYPAARDVTDMDTRESRPRGTGETSLFGNPAPGRSSAQQFALHQQDEMVTYHGGRLEDAAAPDSPTRKR